MRCNPSTALATLAGVLSLTAISAFAQQPQEVAFIGEATTQMWGQQPQFTAHTNWQNDATIPTLNNGVGTVEAQLQTIIASGKKPIVHLLLGTGSYLPSPGDPHSAIFATYTAGLAQIISTAQEANLKIIVGTVPFPMDAAVNAWIFVYCATHKVPVVNYAFALNSGTGFAASIGGGVTVNPANGQPVPQPPVYYSQNTYPFYVLTAQAYALMSDMAQTAIIREEGYQVVGGYLNTVVFNGNSVTDFEDYPTANTNTVDTGGVVQFTPYLQYSDGSTHIANNADINGHLGTWTSSNRDSLFVDEYGVALPLLPGTSNVHFKTLAGQIINEWVMYTGNDSPI